MLSKGSMDFSFFSADGTFSVVSMSKREKTNRGLVSIETKGGKS